MNYLSENLVTEAHQHVDVINLEEACDMLKQGINIIDVREHEEYCQGAIPGAINMPRSVLEFVVSDHLNEKDRQKPHIIYCRSGGRAALAAITMKKMGYANVHAMHGGFAHWEEEGRRIESNPA
ncbi:MAG: hypothetical protein KAH03_01935 [Cocleimonas sp.]|nr:hypothetical protein [Cocleimonas sp.]